MKKKIYTYISTISPNISANIIYNVVNYVRSLLPDLRGVFQRFYFLEFHLIIRITSFHAYLHNNTLIESSLINEGKWSFIYNYSRRADKHATQNKELKLEIQYHWLFFFYCVYWFHIMQSVELNGVFWRVGGEGCSKHVLIGIFKIICTKYYNYY